jgi:hypothetical protein
MGAKRNAYRILVGKSEGKRQLGRPRCRWVDSIKIDLREVGSAGMDWIYQAGVNILSCDRVTGDGVWIGNRIYWTL